MFGQIRRNWSAYLELTVDCEQKNRKANNGKKVKEIIENGLNFAKYEDVDQIQLKDFRFRTKCYNGSYI